MTQEDFFNRYSYDTETDHIGEGGFGEVYKAYDTHIDEWVAIKKSQVKKGQENFTLQKEVELATKLPTHPNIAHYEACYRFTIPMAGTYDFGILKYYDEGNLSDLRKAGKINASNINQILEGILSGLGHLHKHNIIHRDIKPANILIVKRGRDYIPKITDFGISKQGSDAAASAISNSLAGGTYSYAAPEQLKGESKMRRNADLWSFGVIVYQLMTKKLPFEPTTLDTNSEAARNEVTTMILSGKLPEDIETITPPHKELVKQCLVVDKMERVQTAEELIQILNGQETQKTKREPKTPRVEPKTIIETNKEESNQEQIENNDSSDSKDFKTIIEEKPKPNKPTFTPNIKEEIQKKNTKQSVEELKDSAIKSKPKSKRGILIIASIFVFLVISGFGYYFLQASSEEQLVWDKTQTEETIDSYKRYLTLYPDGKHLDEAKENISWIETKVKSTKQGYNQFINKYPKSEKVKQAKKEIESIDYQNLNLNSTGAIKSFMNEYPDSKQSSHLNTELKNLEADSISNKINNKKDFDDYQIAQKLNTKQSYSNYISKYPKGKYNKEAKEKIKAFENIEDANNLEASAWNRADRIASIESYTAYINKYPNGKYSKQARKEIKNKEAARVLTKVDKKDDQAGKGKVFNVVEQMPSFIGGDAAMNKFINKSIVYPSRAKKSGISGRVFITFVIEKNGSITDVKIMRSIGGGCDEEAIRVIKSMPKWNPGLQRGKPVRVQYRMPIKFTLN